MCSGHSKRHFLTDARHRLGWWRIWYESINCRKSDAISWCLINRGSCGYLRLITSSTAWMFWVLRSFQQRIWAWEGLVACWKWKWWKRYGCPTLWEVLSKNKGKLCINNRNHIKKYTYRETAPESCLDEICIHLPYCSFHNYTDRVGAIPYYVLRLYCPEISWFRCSRTLLFFLFLDLAIIWIPFSFPQKRFAADSWFCLYLTDVCHFYHRRSLSRKWNRTHMCQYESKQQHILSVYGKSWRMGRKKRLF